MIQQRTEMEGMCRCESVVDNWKCRMELCKETNVTSNDGRLTLRKDHLRFLYLSALS
jgi:hypothetical protein